MREFFRGWRRKVGVVALLLTCVFAAGWVRSHAVSDRIDFHIRNHYQTVISLDAQLYWWRRRRESKSGYQFGRPLQTSRFLTETDRQQNDGRWEQHPATSRDDNGLRRIPKGNLFTEIVIPYWSIVVPLTFLSAYLLLSKSRLPKTLIKS